MANTVDERFIGRLTPGSNRFNGSFQAGKGSTDQLQDGNAFRVSPRIGAVYDLTGKGETIVRGGFGIFYDRPQGNMVFDMISNAPGVLNSRLDYGRLQDLIVGGRRSEPDVVAQSDRVSASSRRASTSGTSAFSTSSSRKSSSTSPTSAPSRPTCCGRCRSTPCRSARRSCRRTRIRPASRARSLGRRRCRTTSCGRTGGYGDIRMWDYSGYADYKALQTSVTRRFDRGFMVSGFWVWSKAQGINSTDFAAGVPNLSEEQTQARSTTGCWTTTGRTTSPINAIYQTPTVTSSKGLGLLANDWQICRASTGGRAAGRMQISYSIPGIGAANLTGTDGNPNARIALTCDPGVGYSGDPYRQFSNPECFAPPQPGSNGNETPRFFARNPPLQQSRPVRVEELPDCALG